jgi:hypothetical protein
MNISICKWYKNAVSPVLLLIDDLANVWVDVNGNGKIDLEEDWGYGKNGENSSFRFLNEVILKDFPYVKTTFFVPVGVRVGMIESPKIKSISKMINCDEETKVFFKSINDDERFEIAYHGTTHGKAGKTRSDFKQEWELFKSLNEAVETINKGREIYKDVFGCYPKGGKYCGYAANDFSDESIDKTGFMWWCRFYNRDLTEDSITNFDVKTFGSSNVIDIPSTLDGGLLTGIFNTDRKIIKRIGKTILKHYIINKKLEEIGFLLKNNLIISIQEHISPARDDGRRQSPNIFDDKESLRCIFNYLKNKNLWYCTATELAEYYILKNNLEFTEISENEFKVKYTGEKEINNKVISIKLHRKNSVIIEPDSSLVPEVNGVLNIHVEEGIYKVVQL